MSEIELTIDLLFNKCDVILNGMVTHSGIPPVFYWFLLPSLQIKYALSDVGYHFYKEELNKFVELGAWVKLFNEYLTDCEIEKLSFNKVLQPFDYFSLKMEIFTDCVGSERLDLWKYPY